MDASNSTNGGIGFLAALGVIFIVLKLVGAITWPWWVVLLPIYGPLLVFFVVVLVLLVVGGLAAVFNQ